MLNNCYRKSQKSSFRYEKADEIDESSVPVFEGNNIDTNYIVMNRELGLIIEEALKHIPLD